MSSMFPMFVKLEGRTVLVVGAGRVAEGKIKVLLDTGAQIRVVAKKAGEAVREWARTGQIVLEERAYAPADLEGKFLAIVATSSSTVNEAVFREAQRRKVLCNVVDVPELCDFFYPAVVKRGDLQIAVSTAGQSPSLAQHIRKRLEEEFGPGYAEWVAELGATRREVLKSDLDSATKRELLHSLASREAFEVKLAEFVAVEKGDAA
jgi:precorrin-2 dehydrogenase/sirohydrochlorin ferrochelatase